MSEILSILDANDLTDAGKAKLFAFKRDLGELKTFVSGLRQAMLSDSRVLVSEDKPSGLDCANYLPSSSMRGESGCRHWECRIPKIRTLARYVALYCDRAVIPVKLAAPGAGRGQFSEALERMEVAGIVGGIIELRPLIEAELATLVPEELHFCKEHWDQEVPDYKRIVAAAKKLAKKNSDRFTVRYRPPERMHDSASLVFRGPEDYLEHGKIITVLDSIPRWIGDKKSGQGFLLPKETVRERGLVLDFFLRIANDALLQSYFGTAFNARYVTDLAGEADFFTTLYKNDELSRQTAALCARLTHTVPLMNDVPIKTILTLRRNEPEAFQNYRSTLTGIVRTHIRNGKPVTDSEAKEIYLDVLKPQLDALQVQAETARRTPLRKGALRVVATSALIGLGIYSGILPSHVADLVKTIGGFSVTKDLADTFLAIQRNPPEIRNNNLYFLLRLKQEA
jgi:hypothetical protein